MSPATTVPNNKTGIPDLDGPDMRVCREPGPDGRPLSRIDGGEMAATVVIEAATTDPNTARLWLGDHRKASDLATRFAAEGGLQGPAVSGTQGPYAVNAAKQRCIDAQLAGGDSKAAAYRITFTLQGR